MSTLLKFWGGGGGEEKQEQEQKQKQKNLSGFIRKYKCA